jgi:hypothetical protein
VTLSSGESLRLALSKDFAATITQALGSITILLQNKRSFSALPANDREAFAKSERLRGQLKFGIQLVIS